MPETPDPTKLTVIEAETEGQTIAPSHTPEMYSLIETAKQEIKDWVPQWGAKPRVDTKAAETAHALNEANRELVKSFRAPNQHKLLNEKERVRNLMHISTFCAKLHNILGPAFDGGSRIFINTPPAIKGFDNEKMKGLFIKMRGMDQFTYHEDLPPGWKKICSIQTPFMSEWGILLEDDHGGMRGWKYIGWRGQVLLRLILAGAITEEKAHKEFGAPQGKDVDREYHQILRRFREHGERPN